MLRIVSALFILLLLFTECKGEGSNSILIEAPNVGLEKRFEELGSLLEKISEDLARITGSKEFKELEKELEFLGEEIKRSGETFRNKVEKEILPRIEREMKHLREKLRKLGQEDILRPLEIRIEHMRKIQVHEGKSPRRRHTPGTQEVTD